MKPFTAGCVVICIKGSRCSKNLIEGKEYLVVEYESKGNFVQVYDETRCPKWWDAERFKLKIMKTKFKAGDVILSQTDEDPDITKGKPYRVITVDININNKEVVIFKDDSNDLRSRMASDYITPEQFVENFAQKVHDLRHQPEPIKVGDKFVPPSGIIYTVCQTTYESVIKYALIDSSGVSYNCFTPDINDIFSGFKHLFKKVQ